MQTSMLPGRPCARGEGHRSAVRLPGERELAPGPAGWTFKRGICRGLGVWLPISLWLRWGRAGLGVGKQLLLVLIGQGLSTGDEAPPA